MEVKYQSEKTVIGQRDVKGPSRPNTVQLLGKKKSNFLRDGSHVQEI